MTDPAGSAPPTGSSPSASGQSGLTGLVLVLALALANVFVALPLAASLGTLATGVGIILVAVPLDRVGALDQDYERALATAFVLLLLLVVASVVLRLVRAVGRLGNPQAAWARARWFDGPVLMFLVYVGAHLFLLVPVDRLGIVDIDDARLGGVLISAALAAGVLTTVLTGAASLRLTSFVWDLSGRRPVFAGMAIALAGFSGVCGLGVAVATSGGTSKPVQDRLGPIEGSRQMLVEVAHALEGAPRASSPSLGGGDGAETFGGGGDDGPETFGGGGGDGPGIFGGGGGDGPGIFGGNGDDEDPSEGVDPSERRWSSCFTTLHSPPPSPSAVDDALRRVRRDAPNVDADNVVHDVLLAVCTKEREKPRTDIRLYFNASIGNAIRRAWRNPRCSEEPIDECNLLSDSDDEADAIRSESIDAVRTALCHLERKRPNDVQLLRLVYFEGLSEAAIARMNGENPANVRQRLKTAKARFKAEIPKWCQGPR